MLLKNFTYSMIYLLYSFNKIYDSNKEKHLQLTTWFVIIIAIVVPVLLFKDNIELAKEIDSKVREYYGIGKDKKEDKKSKKTTKSDVTL